MGPGLGDVTNLSQFVAATIDKILASKKTARGNTRRLLNELKHNNTVMSLFADGEIDAAAVAASLTTAVFNELDHAGFDFGVIGPRKIYVSESLNQRGLGSWTGKTPEDLLINIYDKIKDFVLRHHITDGSTTYRWSVRIVNIQLRLILLLRNITD